MNNETNRPEGAAMKANNARRIRATQRLLSREFNAEGPSARVIMNRLKTGSR